jgi:Domain of unknown function (DUF2019)
MKRTKLNALTIDQLLQQFAQIGVAQDRALLARDHSRFNRLYDQMGDVDRELRARGANARLELLRLFNHPNIQVRLKAATMTLGIAPVAAREALETIVASKEFPQAGDAGMLISGLDDGTFKPT